MKSDKRKKGRIWTGWWVTAFFVLLIFVFTLIVWREEKSGASCDQQYNSDAVKNALSSAGKVGSTANENTSTQKTNQSSSDSGSYFSRLIAPENLPNIGLFCVGIGGIGVALWTLKIIERQSKATEDNVRALINSERPWLDVAIIPNEKEEGYFFIRVQNKGRTPAEFVSGGIGREFMLKADNLPISPEYEPFFAPNDRLIVPDSYFDIWWYLSAAKAGIDLQTIIENARGNGSAQRTDTLFIYGEIVYDDVFGKDRPDYVQHKTRWCFACFPDGMRIVRTGPSGDRSKEYNSYT